MLYLMMMLAEYGVWHLAMRDDLYWAVVIFELFFGDDI